MAYGNVVGYEPVEGAPDAYRFRLADGSSMPVMGAAAADLKAKVDAADALTASQRTAQNMSIPMPQGEASDAAPTMSVAPPAPAPPPAPEPPPATPAEEAAGMSLPPDAAPQATEGPNMSPNPGPAPRPDPMAGARPYTVGGVNVGVVQMPDGTLRKWSPGSAGSAGGPVQRSETRAGGFDPSQEYLDTLEKTALERKAANEVATAAAEKEAGMRRTFLEEQERQQAVDSSEALARQGQIERDVGDLRKKYDDASREYASAEAPRDRRSAGQVVGGAIFAGIGALGAALAKTPNFALDIINQSISRDIRAQEAAIAIKKEKADTMLGDLRERTGSLDLARSAVRGIRLQQAKLQWDRIAATTSDEKARANALEVSARLDMEHAGAVEDYRQRSLGQVTKGYAITPKVAPSAAGWKGVGAKEAIGLVKEGAALDSSAAGTAKALASVGKGGGAGAKAGQQQADLKAALAGLDQYEAMHAKYGSPGVLNSGVGGSEASQRLGSAANALGPIIGRGLEGNAPNDSTMKDIKGNLLSASGDKIKATIGEYRQQLQNRLRAVEEAGGQGAPEEPPPEEGRQ